MPTFLDIRTMQGDNTGTAIPTIAAPLYLGSIGLDTDGTPPIRVDLAATVGIAQPAIPLLETITIQIRRSSAANVNNFAATTLVASHTFALIIGPFGPETYAYTIAAADYNPTPDDPGQLSYSLWVGASALIGDLTTNGTQTLAGVCADG